MLSIQIEFTQFDPPLILNSWDIVGVSNHTAAFSNGPDKPLTIVELTETEKTYLVALEEARGDYECEWADDEYYLQAASEDDCMDDGCDDPEGGIDDLPF